MLGAGEIKRGGDGWGGGKRVERGIVSSVKASYYS